MGGRDELSSMHGLSVCGCRPECCGGLYSISGASRCATVLHRILPALLLLPGLPVRQASQHAVADCG